ncbi:MAG: MOSC N-terminal beta barrel domain-containing protein [Actinobacteria bacterium]|nr:MOSC N-terminal beta barrel domain-containing protein [Actinomycetota bacterium]
MRVQELWRYPVKSLQGELLQSAALTPQGVEGDRRYAIFDVESGFGLTGRRVPELLFGAARYSASGALEIVLPSGEIATDDAALSDWLGRAVTLRSTDENVSRRYESPDDFENDADWDPFEGASGSFRDSEATVVSLVSEGTLHGWDRRRFRSNILLSDSGEDDLVGTRASLGGAVVEITKRVGRCVMVTRPQPGGVDKDLDVLRTIHRERGGKLAVGASVLSPGPISVGDELLAL